MGSTTTGPVSVTSDVEGLSLLGERLCLDFDNTVDPRHSDHPREFLACYADLVAWAAHTQALDRGTAEALQRYGAAAPAAAAAVFARARALRQAVYGIFSSLAATGSPAPEDLARLDDELGRAMGHARVVPASTGYRWGWDGELPLDRPLWPVVSSAAELLVTGDPARVRECPGMDGCGWLFYDTSKNGSRRWCSMKGCGNRAKSRRHHRRTAT